MKKNTEKKPSVPPDASPLPASKDPLFKFQNWALGILIFIFCLSLFKNISYPLIWNDESETVMMATHVLKYGYPKVHDEKNTVFMMPVNHFDSVKDFRVGYRKESDAFIGNTWGMYYFAALGVLAADRTNDLYQKTFWLRAPFALAALGGLILFGLGCSDFFPDRASYKYFILLFIGLELFSVSLIYHMREARYYSLVILSVAWSCYIYINHFFFNKYSNKKYIPLFVLSLLVSYHINFITFAILCAFFLFHEGLYFIHRVLIIRQAAFKQEFLRILPTAAAILISAAACYPFISFYHTVEISKHVSNDYNFTLDTYRNNLSFILSFFKQQDFYYPALILTVCLLLSLWLVYADKKKWKQLSKSSPHAAIQFQLFLFLFALFLVYTLAIARSPYLFVRHFIVLQPVFTLMMCVEVFLLLGLVPVLFSVKSPAGIRRGVMISCLLLFSLNSSKKIQHIKEHIYQCTHPMKGVLDYEIPYILENVKNPENLTIATNYEEYSYMYYLKSKVVIGFIANELEEAMKLQPDILIYRKGSGGNPEVFNYFLKKGKYKRIAFPVYDYPVNNIPEIEFMIPHLFRTKIASSENEKADLLIKEDLTP